MNKLKQDREKFAEFIEENHPYWVTASLIGLIMCFIGYLVGLICLIVAWTSSWIGGWTAVHFLGVSFILHVVLILRNRHIRKQFEETF